MLGGPPYLGRVMLPEKIINAHGWLLLVVPSSPIIPILHSFVQHPAILSRIQPLPLLAVGEDEDGFPPAPSCEEGEPELNAATGDAQDVDAVFRMFDELRPLRVLQRLLLYEDDLVLDQLERPGVLPGDFPEPVRYAGVAARILVELGTL